MDEESPLMALIKARREKGTLGVDNAVFEGFELGAVPPAKVVTYTQGSSPFDSSQSAFINLTVTA